MKKIRSLLKLFALGVVFVMFRCQTDEIVVENNFQVSKSKVRYLSGNEAFLKAQLLKKQMMLSQDRSARIGDNGTIDYSKILEVIDNEGVANYTFKVNNHPEDSPYVFHNLVLTQSGAVQKVILIKYENDYPSRKMEEFKGEAKMLTLTSSTTTSPCDEVSVPLDFSYLQPITPGGNGTGAGGINNTYNPPPPRPIGGSSGSGGGGFTVSDLPSLQCNSCSFHANSWAAFSTHRDDYGEIYPFTIVLRMRPQLVADPCDPDGDIGVIDEEEKTPCETLQELGNPATVNIKPNVDLLVAKVNSNNNKTESAFSTRKDMIQSDGSIIYTNTDYSFDTEFRGELATGPNLIGGGHSHPERGDPMFSYEDVRFLRDAYEGARGPIKKSEVFFLLVAKHPQTGVVSTYTIKVDNFQALNQVVNDTWNHPKYGNITDEKDRMDEIKRVQAQIYADANGNYEKSFLQQFSAAGISMYKATNDSMTSWNKLALDPNNPNAAVVATPCN